MRKRAAQGRPEPELVYLDSASKDGVNFKILSKGNVALNLNHRALCNDSVDNKHCDF
jgi:hypothetical protein